MVKRPVRGVFVLKVYMHAVCYLQTPCGCLAVEDDGKYILSVHFTARPACASRPSPLGQKALLFLQAYFAGKRPVFNLPLAGRGTAFQQAVWRALQDIPYGQTRTYGQIAAAVGRPKAVRAVGQACHVNPWAVVVPCHRVVGANGKLTGYAGGLNKKAWLLNWEKCPLIKRAF